MRRSHFLWRRVARCLIRKKVGNPGNPLINFGPERSAIPGTRRLHVFERHSPSGMFGVHRTTQKAVVVKDPKFSDVTQIIADGHQLADIGSQSGINLTQPLKVHAISANHAGFRHHDQQQVQLFQAVRHTRQPSLAQPGLDWGKAGFTMGAVVIDP